MIDDKVSNGLGNGNTMSSNKDSERWEADDRRRDDDYHRSSASRRSRRSRSRSRSPRRSRRSKSRSHSPRHDRRSSRSPIRRSGDRGGYNGRGRGPPDDPARRAMNRDLIAAEASKRSVKENRVYVGNLAFSVKWSDLKDFMREGG
ncbi:hypothetical protein DFH28DRAFT_710430 [Melampsora americana]|nr:hypothetical protein DFH28DRAFT_710430 [Melampsora americana]